MARQISIQALEEILGSVQQFPYGASLEEISTALVSSLPRRSLKRYLAFLVKNDRLKAIHQARSRRYCIPSTENEMIGPAIFSSEALSVRETSLVEQPIENFPLSSTALAIQAHVRGPIQARRSVGYNREFLNKYRPNETFYFPENTRKHLFNR